jgi:hypothetical protein
MRAKVTKRDLVWMIEFAACYILQLYPFEYGHRQSDGGNLSSEAMISSWAWLHCLACLTIRT